MCVLRAAGRVVCWVESPGVTDAVEIAMEG
jgi:hypothetical protein